MRKLTSDTWELYKYFVRFAIKNPGHMPTYREAMDDLDITSTSVVNYRVDTLVEHGLLMRQKVGHSDRIMIVGGKFTVAAHPKFGAIAVT